MGLLRSQRGSRGFESRRAYHARVAQWIERLGSGPISLIAFCLAAPGWSLLNAGRLLVGILRTGLLCQEAGPQSLVAQRFAIVRVAQLVDSKLMLIRS